MCGIFGYIGPKDPVTVCLKGLQLLAYRGYDSSGIAGVSHNTLVSLKEIGKLSNLENAVQGSFLQLENAIAHTRWATHGKPTKENAHPHFDQYAHVAVVHNGIISNHFSLKKKLQSQGMVFQSETDTEVISQLFSFYYKGNLLEAFHKTLSDLEGFWAIALIHKDHPEYLLVAAKENPLAIGIDEKKQEVFVSSDVNSFTQEGLNVFFLKNNECALISREGAQVFNQNLEPLSKTLERLSIQSSQISKNGFEHFMLKEIFEQPDTMRQALHGRYLEKQGTAYFEELLLQEEELRTFDHVLFLACGTSWHAGLIAASWIEEKVGITARAEIASEFRYKHNILPKNTLVIAISQSGETFDTIAAIRKVRLQGVRVLAICNVPHSTLTREADSSLFLRAGPEISVCSTKAFTAQLTVLALFTLLLARLRRMSIEEGRSFLEELLAIPIKIDWVLREKDKICMLAKNYARFPHFFFLGRHYMYATSLEGALKLKEISYIHATAYPAGEMKHGPIALVDSELAVIGFCGHEKTLDKMLSNLMEIQAREGHILAFTSAPSSELEKIAQDILLLPSTPDEWSCFLYSVASQLLAYYIAREKGTEIDQPRNLAKSVTVE